MLASIARIVEQFKQSWSRELEDEAIELACQQAGHTWRDRILTPVVTVRLFLLQILHGNTACNHVPHLAALDVTGAAYCEARTRLPLAGSGLFQKVVTVPLRTHDLSGMPQLHPELESDDVLLGDRAFCSFAHVALLMARGVHAIVRAHQKRLIDFRPGRPHAHPSQGQSQKRKGLPRSGWIKALAFDDQLVEWFKPVNVPAWLSVEAFAALPDMLWVRELRYPVARPGFRVRKVALVTTLCDAELYPAEELAEAYGLRWTIEVNFRHLKTTMKRDVLRCQTVAGVTQELTMFLRAYNLVRMTMLEAARRQSVAVERIRFIDALRWLASARPGDELPELVVNPHRRRPLRTPRSQTTSERVRPPQPTPRNSPPTSGSSSTCGLT